MMSIIVMQLQSEQANPKILNITLAPSTGVDWAKDDNNDDFTHKRACEK